MALNPPFFSDGEPVPIPGETFLVRRKHIEFTLKDATGKEIFAFKDCTAYLTSVRIAIWLSTRGTSATSVDIPLQGISNEDVKQPVFGAPALVGLVAAVPGKGFAPGLLSFKIGFKSGGFGIFMAVFASIMERGYRNASVDARRSFLEAQVFRQDFIMAEQQAFMDPSDPSHVFVVQPAAARPGPTPSYAFPSMPTPGAQYSQPPQQQPQYAQQPQYGQPQYGQPQYGQQPQYAQQQFMQAPPGYAPQPAPAYGANPPPATPGTYLAPAQAAQPGEGRNILAALTSFRV